MFEFKIDKTCISCGRCAEECPVEAISKDKTQYVIDADECIGCGLCARKCPVEAIHEE